jgi:hypothetical protein
VDSAIYQFLLANAHLLLGLALLWVVLWTAWLAWRRYRRGPIHPPYTLADVRYREPYASGRSHRDLVTRFGGARNALVVTVLDQGLLIEPMPLFKWLTPMRFRDLEHYIPHADLLKVETIPGFGREKMKIEFRAADGERHVIELALRHGAVFRNALGGPA